MNKNTFVNLGVILGDCVKGNNNTFYNLCTMPENINEVIVNLAKSQAKLADAISESISKRAEADLIRVLVEKQIAENVATELKIKKEEAENNNILIQNMQKVLSKMLE